MSDSPGLNAVQIHAGYPVEPADIHASVRHLHAFHDILTISEKTPNAYSLGAQRNIDCLEMVRIARGISAEQIDQEPSVTTIINTNSPLRLDHPAEALAGITLSQPAPLLSTAASPRTSTCNLAPSHSAPPSS